MAADYEWAAARLTWRGKHEGVFQGLSPSNRNIETGESGFMRIEGGKVAGY